MRASSITELPAPDQQRTGWPWSEETPSFPPYRQDGTAWPRISIVTPSFNQGEFIEETIRSVLLQGYPDLDFIIIDGGSTDETIRIIKKYEQWLTFWVSEKDDGQSDAINKGFARATGEIINWLNSDDFLAQDALQAIAEAFAGVDEKIGAVVGAGHKLDENYQPSYSPLSPTINRETLVSLNARLLQPACYVRRSAWVKCGPIRNDLHYCMDFAFWLEMSCHYEFRIIRTDIAFAHVHDGAKTTSQRKRLFAEIAIVLAQQPEGFQWARSLAMDLVDGKMVDDRLPGRQLAKELLIRVTCRLRKALGAV